MVVRERVDERWSAAGVEDRLGRRGPDRRADEVVAAVGPRQHQRLRAVRTGFNILTVPCGELLDQYVAEKGRVVAEPAQHPRGVIEAPLVARIEPARAQRFGAFGEADRGIVGKL